MNILKTLIIFIISMGYVSAQSNFGLDVRTGFIQFDKTNNPIAPKDILTAMSFQSDASLYQETRINQFLSTKVGVGYSNFFYLEDAGYKFSFLTNNAGTNSFVNLIIGIQFTPFRKFDRLSFYVEYRNYILLQKRISMTLQNETFSNLDLGLDFDVTDRFSMSISTPVSLTAMISGTGAFLKPGTGVVLFEAWVEMTGFNLGFQYNF